MAVMSDFEAGTFYAARRCPPGFYKAGVGTRSERCVPVSAPGSGPPGMQALLNTANIAAVREALRRAEVRAVEAREAQEREVDYENFITMLKRRTGDGA